MIITSGMLFTFILLVIMVNSSMKDGYIPEFWNTTSVLWKYSVGIFLTAGLLYPAYLLSAYPTLRYATKGQSPISKILSNIPRFSAWALVTRRYYGLVFGWYTILMCFFVITYYLVFRLFPWQHNLIINGLLDAESELLYVITTN